MILFDGEVGKIYIVKSINGCSRATKRLNDMGVIPDVKVKLLSKLCPVIVEVRKSRLAIGMGLAKKIEVEEDV